MLSSSFCVFLLIKVLYSEKDCSLDLTMESLISRSGSIRLAIMSLGLSADSGSSRDLLSKLRPLLLLKGEEVRELFDYEDLSWAGLSDCFNS
jgi:hypothetical protein